MWTWLLELPLELVGKERGEAGERSDISKNAKVKGIGELGAVEV